MESVDKRWLPMTTTPTAVGRGGRRTQRESRGHGQSQRSTHSSQPAHPRRPFFSTSAACRLSTSFVLDDGLYLLDTVCLRSFRVDQPYNSSIVSCPIHGYPQVCCAYSWLRYSRVLCWWWCGWFYLSWLENININSLVRLLVVLCRVF